MALDIIANETWDDVDKAWDAFTYETWDGWIEFSYALKIYDTSGDKVAEITGDLKNPTLTNLEFENLKQGGCGAFSFTLAKPYTQATITYDYKVEVYIFNPVQVLFYTGKIINKPVEGTDKPQTYSGWGYFNELEKKIIDTEIAPGSDIAVAVTSILDTHITPYTSILKDATLIETVSHVLVATIDFEDEYANEIFKRLTELAVDYKFGVNENTKFYFQAIDTSINYYWHVGKHLSEFHPEEDPSELVKKVIAVYPEVFTDGYRLKITSEAGDYAGLYDKRFSLPEIVNPFSTTDIASGITPTTNPVAGTPANMTDGDYSTLWESGANQASGHYIIIDLTTDFENIAAVVIDSIHSNAQEYNAKSVKIEVKPDGGSYATMLSSDDDIGWKPTLTFRPTNGRYVKISLTGSLSEEWKVGEVEIYQLDLTDAQRWADWKLTTLENVKKRATARISNIQSMIMDTAGLVPIKPIGKARIFDRNGTKIDDYQVIACKYRLSSGGFLLDLELGAEEITTTDRDREWQRRIRELENSGVRRAKNLSLSKGFQLSKITGTYIGEDAIQTKHLAAQSVLAGAIAVVGIDANGQLVLGEIGSGDFDDIDDSVTYVKAEMQAAYDETVKYRSTGVPTNNPTPTTITKYIKANGSMDIKLGWGTYTQGAKQADVILLFWEKSTEVADKIWDEIDETWDDATVGEETWNGTSLAAPVVTDSCITFNVNTSAGSYFIMEGVNPNSLWSFGIAAARRTENGLEIGAIQSPTTTPDWQDVTSNSPNYVGNVHGVPAVNIQEWADNPAGRVNTQATLILPGKLYLNWATGQIVIGQDALGTDQPGMVINDGTYNRAEFGKLNGDYGVNFRDINGDLIVDAGEVTERWRKIYDNTLTDNATSVELSGLDGDDALNYFIDCKWIKNGTALNNFGIQCNNDSGAASYGNLSIFGNGGGGNATTHEDYTLGLLWLGRADTDGHLSQGHGFLQARSSYARSLVGQMMREVNVSGKNIGGLYSIGATWWNTADNLTVLDFLSEVATGLKIGTHLMVFQRIA